MRRRALVTGGSGAIGSAICRQLANDGWHVIVHANRGIERAQALARTIVDGGMSAEACAFDLRDVGATSSDIEALLRDGPVQGIVHNAGVHVDGPLAGMSYDAWRAPIDVALNGFFGVVQPLLLPMLRTRFGRVVAISSVAGIMGNRGQANYAAAKAGLHGAIKSLAREVASRGVTANVVAPGIVEGGMSEGTFDVAAIERIVPMKRAGRPEEVAGLVGFLMTEAAAYLSGQVIAVDGAMT
ncbi:MAG TPA: 3-oxoacyl-ACP reductase FabG [Casimicrobiaceae bacterium]|nr:3-oxoacyl-ACP reductase FabG [Casimicrobiaceae bacterium]